MSSKSDDDTFTAVADMDAETPPEEETKPHHVSVTSPSNARELIMLFGELTIMVLGLLLPGFYVYYQLQGHAVNVDTTGHFIMVSLLVVVIGKAAGIETIREVLDLLLGNSGEQ